MSGYNLSLETLESDFPVEEVWQRLAALADSAFDADTFQSSRAARLPWIQDIFAAVAIPPIVSIEYQLPRPLLRRDQFGRVLDTCKGSRHPLASRIARAAWLAYLHSIPAKCVQSAFLCLQARYMTILKCKTLMVRLREVLGWLHGRDFLKDPAHKFNFDWKKARMAAAPHPREVVAERVAAVIEIDSDGEIQVVSDRVGVDPNVATVDSIATEIPFATPIPIPVAQVVEVPFAQVDVVQLEQSIQRLDLADPIVPAVEQESVDLPLPEPLEVEEGTLALIESLESVAIGMTGPMPVPLPIQGCVCLPVERIQLAPIAVATQELEVETDLDSEDRGGEDQVSVATTTTTTATSSTRKWRPLSSPTPTRHSDRIPKRKRDNPDPNDPYLYDFGSKRCAPGAREAQSAPESAKYITLGSNKRWSYDEVIRAARARFGGRSFDPIRFAVSILGLSLNTANMHWEEIHDVLHLLVEEGYLQEGRTGMLTVKQ